MKIEEVDISELKEYEGNAKKHPNQQISKIARSIDQFGFNQPLVADSEGVIIVGHGRYLAAKKLGMETVPIIRASDLTPEQVAAYRLADNKLNESVWDMDKVAEEMQELRSAGFDLEMTGFSFDLIAEETPKEERLPENPYPISRDGDIFQLGEHRVMCGDALDKNTVKRLFSGKRANMCFTDPPYNVDYTGGTKEKLKIQNDRMGDREFHSFLFEALSNVIDITDGAIYAAMSFIELGTIKSAFEAAGGRWSTFIIWVKSTFTLGRSDYQRGSEPILYGWPARIKDHYFIGNRDLSDVWEDIAALTTNFDGTYTSIKFQGFEVKIKGEITEGLVRRRKQRSDIWRFDKPRRSGQHPTMKPVALVIEAIRNSSRAGDIVFDPFLGSGSTVIAAEMMKRTCYGIEIDPHYVDVVVKRWEEYTGNKAVKL